MKRMIRDKVLRQYSDYQIGQKTILGITIGSDLHVLIMILIPILSVTCIVWMVSLLVR
jgi:hypothetical protein